MPVTMPAEWRSLLAPLSHRRRHGCHRLSLLQSDRKRPPQANMFAATTLPEADHPSKGSPEKLRFSIARPRARYRCTSVSPCVCNNSSSLWRIRSPGLHRLHAKLRQHMVYVYASLSRLDFQGLLENVIVVF